MRTRATAAESRKQARATAMELIRARVEEVGRLAERGTAVDAAQVRVDAAREELRSAQTAYAEQYRAARAAGWSVSELDEAGCDQRRAGTALRTAARRDTDEDSAVGNGSPDSVAETDEHATAPAPGDPAPGNNDEHASTT